MKSLLAKLGPGLLYAGAAVGVSHLVQSTRAGASYGSIMILVVILANIIKYPFFKAGPLYSIYSRKSLLEGFHALGPVAMGLFYLVTFSTIFAVQAVVTLITASVFSSIFNLDLPLWIISSFLLLTCSIILLLGKYKLLSNIMKIVITLLTITTVVTLVAAFINYQPREVELNSFSFLNEVDIFFLIALVGWMPAPLDISLWHSEWTLAEPYESNQQESVKKVSFDFNVGYWSTTFLAIAFVGLGTLLLRTSGISLASSGTAFSSQIIEMYTSTLGKWSFVFVALAAFTTMFSTTLTVLDAYPRILSKAVTLQFEGKKLLFLDKYWFWLSITSLGALFVLIYQLKNMKQLVDFATTISFLTAPVLASLIYYVVRESGRDIFKKRDKTIANLGLIFLYCFSTYYFWIKYS